MTPELFGALLGIAALALVLGTVAAVKWIVTWTISTDGIDADEKANPAKSRPAGN